MIRKNISVCMATYNGSQYIVEQINSILKQLIEGDELIIIDDCSKDNTVKILKNFIDERIKIFENNVNIGVNKSFERAIAISKNEFIFMADQDDIWVEDRVNKIIEKLELNNIMLVSGNQYFIDENGKNINFYTKDLDTLDSKKILKNIFRIFMGKAPYVGCAMGFKREFKNYILPFPNYIESHDLWIAKMAILKKKNYHLNDKILKRRIHGKNTSIISRPIKEKIYSRWIFIKSIFEIINKKISY